MRALVLSGGGSKGAYQVGALKKWMLEDGLEYDIIAGVSVGAINGACLAQVPIGHPQAAWRTLKSSWDQADTSKVRKPWCPFGVLSALWKPSVYNSEPLQNWISNGLDLKKIATSGRILRVVAVSWDTGESRVVSEDDPHLDKWVAASSSFPGMLTPIKLGNQLWTDGGIRNVTPLGEAIRAGATHIDVIMCSNPEAKDLYESDGKSVPSLAFRAIDLMVTQIVRADLKICGLKNDLAGPYRKVDVRILMPETSLATAMQSLDFSPPFLKRMMEIGYQDACKLGSAPNL